MGRPGKQVNVQSEITRILSYIDIRSTAAHWSICGRFVEELGSTIGWD